MRYVALSLAALGMLLLVALGWSLTSVRGQPQERGLLTSVEARDIGHAASIALRTTDGRELRFQVDNEVDMTPGHLREHMTFGEPVTVHYRRSAETLVAVRITD